MQYPLSAFEIIALLIFNLSLILFMVCLCASYVSCYTDGGHCIAYLWCVFVLRMYRVTLTVAIVLLI